MEVIQRGEDKLLVGVVRESIFTTAKAQARTDLERMAESHGQFMLVRRDKLGATVAIAEMEGFLLAECLIPEFGNNFIYVEEYSEGRVILVGVVSGVVRADTIVAADDLRSDMSSLFLLEPDEHRGDAPLKFDIRTSGNVPLLRHGAVDEEQVAFYAPPADRISTWEEMDPEYRLRVPLLPSAKLKPWKQARTQAFSHPVAGPFAAAAAIGVVAIAVSMFWPKQEAVKQADAPPPDPLAPVYQAWSSKMPVGDAIRATTEISWYTKKPLGWRVKTIKLSGNGASVTLEQALPEASLKSAQVVFDAQGIPTGGSKELNVVYPLRIAGRDRPTFERNLDAVRDIRREIDRLHQDPWGLNVVVQSMSMGTGFRQTAISLKGYVPEVVMEEIAKVLRSRYPNSATEALEYDPSKQNLSLTFTLYTRS